MDPIEHYVWQGGLTTLTGTRSAYYLLAFQKCISTTGNKWETFLMKPSNSNSKPLAGGNETGRYWKTYQRGGRCRQRIGDWNEAVE